MMTRIGFLILCLLLPHISVANEIPNCIARVHKFKHPQLPVKKDVLRNQTGCVFTINWGIEEGKNKPDLYDIRSSQECEKIGKRLERAWRKSILFRGESVAHCQTRIQIKCPDRKKVCRIIFQLPEGDPVYDAS